MDGTFIEPCLPNNISCFQFTFQVSRLFSIFYYLAVVKLSALIFVKDYHTVTFTEVRDLLTLIHECVLW